jgi:hypothetical protein
MPLHPSVKVCSHIKVTGVRCGSPALRGEQFCYFHERMLRGVQIPNNVRLHPVALIEDNEAIQASLMEVINAVARNSIDLRRADLMLKALHIAVKNSHRINFEYRSRNAVEQLPEYPAQPKPPRPAEIPAARTQPAIAPAVVIETPIETPKLAAPPAVAPTPPADPARGKPPRSAPATAQILRSRKKRVRSG